MRPLGCPDLVCPHLNCSDLNCSNLNCSNLDRSNLDRSAPVPSRLQDCLFDLLSWLEPLRSRLASMKHSKDCWDESQGCHGGTKQAADDRASQRRVLLSSLAET